MPNYLEFYLESIKIPEVPPVKASLEMVLKAIANYVITFPELIKTGIIPQDEIEENRIAILLDKDIVTIYFDFSERSFRIDDVMKINNAIAILNSALAKYFLKANQVKVERKETLLEKITTDSPE